MIDSAFVMQSIGGLLVLATSGGTALGVRRLLRNTDALTVKVDTHGLAIAAMEVKLPNGEWRAIKDGVAEVRGDIATMRSELGQHILDEMAWMKSPVRPRARKRK